MLWAPFVFAFVLGGVIAGGLLVGYIWPSPSIETMAEPDAEPDK